MAKRKCQTIRIDAHTMRLAKAIAAAKGTSVNQLIEDLLAKHPLRDAAERFVKSMDQEAR